MNLFLNYRLSTNVLIFLLSFAHEFRYSFPGLLYDWTGNYNISFYSAGAALALAGVICLPLRRVARWQKQKELEAAENRNIYKPVSGPNINGHATNA